MIVVLAEPYGQLPGHYAYEVKGLAAGLRAVGASVAIATLDGLRGASTSETSAATTDGTGIVRRFAQVSCRFVRKSHEGRRYTPSLASLFASWAVLAHGLSLISQSSSRERVLILQSGDLLAFLLFALLSPVPTGYIIRDVGRFAAPATRRAGVRRRLENALSRLVCHRAVIFFTLGEEIAGVYRNSGLVGRFVYTPPNGMVRRDPPSMLESRDILSLPSRERILLVFGAAHASKDYEVIATWAGSETEKPVKIVIAGAATSANDPQVMIQRIGSPASVIVRTGFVPDSLVAYYFGACNAVLLSYREGYDIDSGVFDQAVSFGLPIVASSVGSLGQRVHDHGLGFTFNAGDVRSLELAIEQFCGLSDLDIARLHQRVLEYRETRPTWAEIAQIHFSAYRDLQQ